MEYRNNDMVITVKDCGRELELKVSSDCDCTTMAETMASILKYLTYGTHSIITALRDVADSMEEDARLCSELWEGNGIDGGIILK